MCKSREITRTVSRVVHVSAPALPHFTQTLFNVVNRLCLITLLTLTAVELSVLIFICVGDPRFYPAGLDRFEA